MNCPQGHDSASTDYCDVCGMRLTPGDGGGGDAGSGDAGGAAAGAGSGGAGGGAGAGEVCPRCGAVRSGQFCESCGFNFVTGTPAPPDSGAAAVSSPDAGPAPAPPADGDKLVMAWTAIVTADRAYYDAVRAAGGNEGGEIPFPAYCPERRFRLGGREVRIGRCSPSRGLEPEIDLTGPPLDPGVSRLHAVLIALPEGGWAVIDPGSVNGTQVNGADIPEGQQVPLNDGDRISIGAWTTVTVRAE